jgi:hypothetical protein
MRPVTGMRRDSEANTAVGRGGRGGEGCSSALTEVNLNTALTSRGCGRGFGRKDDDDDDDDAAPVGSSMSSSECSARPAR